MRQLVTSETTRVANHVSADLAGLRTQQRIMFAAILVSILATAGAIGAIGALLLASGSELGCGAA